MLKYIAKCWAKIIGIIVLGAFALVALAVLAGAIMAGIERLFNVGSDVSPFIFCGIIFVIFLIYEVTKWMIEDYKENQTASEAGIDPNDWREHNACIRDARSERTDEPW